MRSSVVESRPSGDLGTGSSYAMPRPEFRPPIPQRYAARKPQKRRFALTPGEGWLALLLLAIAVYSVVFSIISANWVGNSYVLLWSTAIGLLVGLCVAKTRRFPQVILHLGAVLAGHWLSIWLTSVVAFHTSWLLLLEGLRSVITGGFTTPAAADSQMVFLFYLTFLCFFLGYFGAWLVYRAHLPWLVAVVYCAIMLVNLNFIGQDLSYLLLIMLGALILLIARMQLNNQLNQWISQGLHTDRAWLQNINRRFLRVSCVLMLLILLISWMLPALAQPGAGANFWNGLNYAWTDITHGQFSPGAPGSLLQPYPAPANFFGDQLTITGSVNLPTGEVLDYTSTASPQAQYLEGFTFDHFDGHTWTSSAWNGSQPFGAKAPLPLDGLGNSNKVTTVVTIVLPPEGTKHYLFAPEQPASFNVPTALYGNGNGGIVTAWTQQDPLTPQERYQVISFVPAATAQDLSTVSFPQNDPKLWSRDPNAFILDRYYLQKPTDLPPSVIQTARQWTQGSTSVYDAMKKLESHLSNLAQFTYAVTNPPVPANIDAVAWLLQTHKGYCTYYASAMTIMARLLGVPARVVNGFSQGSYDPQRKEWVVEGTDAHSWVQVYFPGFGWINFDPTPGFSSNGSVSAGPTPVHTQTPGKPTPTANPGTKKPGSQNTPAPGSTGPGNGRDKSGYLDKSGTYAPGAGAFQNLFLTLSLLALFASLILLGFALLGRYRSRDTSLINQLSTPTVATAIFWRVCRLGRWAGLPPQHWQTPYEYSRVLGRRFPQVATSLRRVTELFVRERWAAPHQWPRAAEEQALKKLWPHLRNAFFRSLFLRWNGPRR